MVASTLVTECCMTTEVILIHVLCTTDDMCKSVPFLVKYPLHFHTFHSESDSSESESEKAKLREAAVEASTLLADLESR